MEENKKISAEAPRKKLSKREEKKAAFAALDEFQRQELADLRAAKTKVWKQALKYAICTASAGLIEFLTFTLFKETLPIDDSITVNFITQGTLLYFVSTAISLTLSILWNFTINRKFTFKSAGNVPRAMFLAFLFYVPFFPFKLWANSYLPGVIALGAASPYIVEVCTMLLNGVLEFCWQKFFIYRKEDGSAVVKKYGVGEVGEFGEIGIKEQDFSGEDIHSMLSAGLDISAMSDKQMKRWLTEQGE